MSVLKIFKEDGHARSGELKTSHGRLKTPFFMPVATKACVKTLGASDLKLMGFECIISNAFILSVKPGVDLIEKMGGLHKFMRWNKGSFTDSGGFQILNPDFLLEKKDQGVIFKNFHTGKKELFTPELSVEIQNRLGSDVAMCLDDIPHHDASKDEVKLSIKRTIDWAKRCLVAHNNKKQLLFGIAQGGVFPDLRMESGKHMNELGFDGISIGGLCIGESSEQMFRALDAQLKVLDVDKPKYLMGVGSPRDVLEAVSRGVDIFDSVYPTRNARRGSLLTSKGQIKITSREHRFSKDPIEVGCGCFACKNYSKAYISHLVREQESFGLRLASIHNLYFLSSLMQRVRDEIRHGNFDNFKVDFLKNYKTKV